MSELLNEKRQKGDRWFLALVDPLLPAGKPFYIPLRKNGVKVGFLPDCDFMLPCASMGLDIASDSRRLDPEYNLNRRHPRFNWWPNVGAIGERDKEPFFIMSFEGSDDDNFSWKVSCPVGHHCRVAYVWERMMGGDVKLFPELEEYDTDDQGNMDPNVENPGSELTDLRDGYAFEFIWPYWTYGAQTNRYCSDHDIPPQALRFVFIEELVDDEEEHTDVIKDAAVKLVPEQRLFTSLPVEVLARIASYMEPEEFLQGLALATRVFTSPAMKHSIPWKSLTMYDTFDALRVAEMAAPNTVCSMVCPKLWDDSQSYAVFLKWKPLILQDALTYMQIYDPRLLCCTGVPPNLKELWLMAKKRKSLKQFWTKLKYVQLSASTLKKLNVSCLDGSRRLSSVTETGELGFSRVLQPGDLLEPTWLASACSHVETLHLASIPFVESNFGLIPEKSFEHLTHLVLLDMRPGFPFEKMKKLFLVEISFAPGVDLRDMVLPEDFVFDHLRSFAVRNGLDHKAPCDGLLPLLRKMPKLEYVKWVTKCYHFWPLCHDVAGLCPNLRVLWVSRAAFNLYYLANFIAERPHLVELTIVESKGFARGAESRDKFPHGEHVNVRWQRWRDIDGDKEERFSFFFSRLSDAEHQKLVKLYCYEPFR